MPLSATSDDARVLYRTRLAFQAADKALQSALTELATYDQTSAVTHCKTLLTQTRLELQHIAMVRL